ncbi:DUF2004 domain-containing protein [Ruegeria arenilitoris]|uniref:DUF2004 domain-containing protein n=1 Tax=Ruegeria arenilitoris TaxID=1173585 RepID=UPI00147F48CA|nr:DUF2004 domain-containing protein [Ruegeria arenilitoris]
MSIDERERDAREKIKALYGTPEGEFGPTLFVSHHKEELETDYWTDTYSTDAPTAEQILDSLVLVDTWSSEDDDNVDTYDFSLPNEATNYLLSARFEDGEVVEVSMES